MQQVLKILKQLKTLFILIEKLCLAHGLEIDNKQCFDALEEFALSKMPSIMRILFTQILVFGDPADPNALWERFKNQLAEDFIWHERRNNLAEDLEVKRAYENIASKKKLMAIEGRNLNFWVE